ncbi:D-alanyl-D-alanine carboxypeptidase/D-alanyl-D-alanine-endopeptidase [bacterium]|nr:D-alanyl-D-alanine carboxypeptidase/D-alanyl-D-alanine-endopeptidase [bacterium]
MNKKILLSILGMFFITCNTAMASLSSKIDQVISSSGINSSAVAVSVKDVKTGNNLVKIRSKQPMIPASTQKILTYPVVLETLGSDYLFSTKIYYSKDKEVYLKLSADPFFATEDLKKLIKSLKENSIITCKEFYIDDYIMDFEDWGEGWQWDNDLNPLMPRYSVYNIDGNLLTVVIRPTTPDSPADVKLTKFYPVTFMNLVKTGNSDNVVMSRKNNISPDILTLEGTVKKQVIKKFPVNNPKRYFMIRLDEAVKGVSFDYYGKYPQKKYVPNENIKLVSELSHSLSRAGADILKNSNNMAAETVYKIAGGKYADGQGTIDNANKMFLDYCERNGLDTSDIRVVDGSGVSKNNIMTADFMTAFLVNLAQKDNFEELYNLMPAPTEGTLANRMLYLKDNLKAKTGTLSDVSAIAGYLKTKSGNFVAFDIMINNHKIKNSSKKILEEEIIKTIYMNN